VKGRTEVRIDNIGFEAMQRFLSFLYTDSVEDKSQTKALNTKQLIELIYLAEKFKVDKLKKIAEYYARKSLSVESIALALRTACEFQNHAFKTQCIEFIMKHFGEVIGTSSFLELPSEILREVLTAASIIGVSVQDNQTT